nr:protein PF14_0175-like [Leptinotarsa decemlineata]
MKILTFYLAMLGSTLAVPNGYYHQEYNYKTSSSSFKNNELQHKTDDQGYYRKDGDLEGRVKPVVDANSEHSEYVNPNAQGTYGYNGGANTDFSSTGNMRAQSGYTGYGSNALDAEGYAQSDRLIGSRGYSSGYSSGYGSNSIGSNSQSYGTSSNLRLITSRLQQELESELHEAVRQNNIYPQSRVDISQLERELRRNLTERLNNELNARYGQQMVRGGMSYTITGGRLQSTANYDNEELSNLRRQLENSLVNQLRTQYSSSSSSNSQYYNRQGSYGYTTVRPVYSSVYPSLPTYTTTLRYPVDYNHANYQTIRYTPITNPQSITNIASNIQSRLDSRLNEVLDETRRKYFSTNSQYSLTNTDVLLERIRNELRSNLTYLLDEDIRRNYGTQIQRDGYLYSVGPTGQTSTDYNYSLRDLENLKQQVERNLIDKLNRDFETYRSSWSSHQSYNSQSSFGSNYQYSSTPRYEYISSPRYAYTTPRYEIFTTPRQSYINQYPTSASQHGGYIQTGGGASNQYEHVSGSQQSGYGMQSSGSIAQLQRQLQDDLSSQLRGALRTGHYSSYSSGGISSPQNYQTTLQQLSDELNRNLTRHLQEYSAMGSYAAYGNFDSAQMQRLKAQLQDSLMNQLQQGLQQSYQSSSSYSSSSSSSSSSSGNSNYRPVRGFQNYQSGQYRSGIETLPGEDCLGDDPNAHSYSRSKRSYGLTNGNRNYHRRPDEFIQQTEDSGKTSTYEQSQNELGQLEDHENFQFSLQGRDQAEVGQQIDHDYDSDLTQQVLSQGQLVDHPDLTQQVEEDSAYGKLQLSNHGQQVYDSEITQQQVDNGDLTQQVEDSGYGKLQISNHGQQIDEEITQQVDNGDLTQQVEDLTQQVEESVNGKLQISNHGQQVDDTDLTQQQVDNGDLTQQVEDSGYGKLQISNHGQQVDDTDLTQQQVDNGDLIQQVEDSNYEKLQISNHGQQVDDTDLTQQQVDNEDLTQQVEDFSYGKLQISNHGQQVDDTDLTQQQVDNGDLTQQVENSDYGKLQISNHGQQIDEQITQQQVDNGDLTQQVEDSNYGKLQVSNHGQQIDEEITQQQVDNGDLTQQVEDSSYGKLQVSNHGQQIDEEITQQQVHNGDLTQQVENSDYGKLQLSNHGQQITEQVVVSPEYGSDHIQTESKIWDSQWCSKYIDTSIMDAPWTLSRQLEDEIVRQYHQLNDGNTKLRKEILFKKIVEKLPENIMYICFHVNNMKMNKQEEDEEVKGLESYFRFLIKKKINDIIEDVNDSNGQKSIDVSNQKPNKEEVAPETLIPDTQPKSIEDTDEWCSNYIDTSLMDAPWELGNQLKAEIDRQYHLQARVITKPQNDAVFQKIIGELPDNIMSICFNIPGMKLSERDSDKVKKGLEDYFRFLIKQEISRVAEADTHNNQKFEQQEKLEATPEENLDNQHNQRQFTSQVIESNGVNNEHTKKPEGAAFVITEQGQFYQRPQTKPEAEQTADSLINALRNSQRNPQNQQRVVEDYGYHRRYGYGSYGSQNHVYESYRPYRSRYSHYPKYNNPGSSVIHEDPSYEQHRSYEYQNQYPSYNKPSDYEFKPLKYNNENLESASSSPQQYRNLYHQHPSYPKPLNYGRTEVIEQNFETVSDLKPERTYPATVEKPVRPVYSEVKGPSKFRSHSYQPISPQPQPISPQSQPQPDLPQPQLSSLYGQPSPVVEPVMEPVVEPVVKQKIVDSVDDSQVVREETTPAQVTASTTDENFPWWKRFGNKVKQGASDLKKKIIG